MAGEPDLDRGASIRYPARPIAHQDKLNVVSAHLEDEMLHGREQKIDAFLIADDADKANQMTRARSCSAGRRAPS